MQGRFAEVVPNQFTTRGVSRMRRVLIACIGLSVLIGFANVSIAQVRDPISRKSNPELGFFEPKKSTAFPSTSKGVRTSQNSAPTKSKWFFKKLFR